MLRGLPTSICCQLSSAFVELLARACGRASKLDARPFQLGQPQQNLEKRVAYVAT